MKKKDDQEKVADGMDRLLALLQETDQLLKRVESNLATVQEIGKVPLTTIEEIKEKLGLLVKKHKEAEKALLEKKEAVLKVLVEISLLFGARAYPRDGLRDIVVREMPNGILIGFDGGLPYFSRAYTPSMLCKADPEIKTGHPDDYPFYCVCYRIIEEIPKLVGQMSHQATAQAQEMERLRQLLTDIAKMEIPKV